MNYLKPFYKFESDSNWPLASNEYHKRQEIINMLSEMSLELWDNNFNVQVSSEVLSRTDKYIIVTLQKRGYNSTFKWSDVSETIDTMISYLTSEGLKFNSMNVSVIDNSYYFESLDKVEELFSHFTGDILQIKFKFGY
jgi:hypothetical protein